MKQRSPRANPTMLARIDKLPINEVERELARAELERAEATTGTLFEALSRLGHALTSLRRALAPRQHRHGRHGPSGRLQ